MPKVWTKAEIMAVMKAELVDTAKDAAERRRPVSTDDLIEMIFMALDGNGLIQYEP